MKILIYTSKKSNKANRLSDLFASTLSACLTEKLNIDVQNELTSPITSYSLVHILGTWRRDNIKLLSRCKKQNIPILYTPLGELETWNVKKRYRKFVKNVSAVHLTSAIELQLFDKLKWNNRTQVIKNALVTNTLTDEEMSTQMIRLYNKVLDSNCYSAINEDIRDAIFFLILAGTDPTSITDIKQIRECLAKLTFEDLRYIYIYSFNEGIIDVIRNGFKAMNYNAPSLDVDNIELFSPIQPILTDSLKHDKLLSKNIRLKRQIAEIKDEQHVIDISIMINNIKHEVNNRTVSIRHLLDLYTKVKFNNYNEDLLYQALKRARLSKFAARLMFILKDIIGLPEGFIPIKTIDDRQTDKLRMIITKLK